MKTYAEWAKDQPVNELRGFLSNLFNTGMGRPTQPNQQQQQITLPVAQRLPNPPVAQPVGLPGQQGPTLARRAPTAQPEGRPQPAPGTTLANRPQQPTPGIAAPPTSVPTQPAPGSPPAGAPAAPKYTFTSGTPSQTPQTPPAVPQQPQQPAAPDKGLNPKNPFGAAPFQKPPTPADGNTWTDWLKRNNLPTDYQPGQPTNMRDRAKQGLSYQATKGMDKGYLDSVARKYQKPQQPPAGPASYLYQPGA